MARDTRIDWEAIGSSEPWFGVLSAPKFLTANLTKESQEEFYKQGQEEVEWVVAQIKRQDPTFLPKQALDFGSGLGRLSFAMAAFCDTVSGVDVSPGMIAEARRQALSRNIHNVQFTDIIPPGGRFDWINSYIVFQHILPSSGYAIIAELLSCLASGGWMSLQLTFAHDFRDVTSWQRDAHAYRYDGENVGILEFRQVAVGEMSMYDYDLNRVLYSFIRSGLRTVTLVHTDHGGVHGFWLFARKP